MLDTFLTKFLPMAFATNGLKNNIPVALFIFLHIRYVHHPNSRLKNIILSFSIV